MRIVPPGLDPDALTGSSRGGVNELGFAGRINTLQRAFGQASFGRQ